MKTEALTRRDFVRDGVRALLLGALAGVCAVFWGRRSQVLACANTDACGRCRDYDRCIVRTVREPRP